MLRNRHVIQHNDVKCKKCRKLGGNIGHGNGVFVEFVKVLLKFLIFRTLEGTLTISVE